MGFFRSLFGYGLVYHAAKSGAERAVQKEVRKLSRQKPVPFETTVKLHIPVDDDIDPEDLQSILSGIEIDVPPGVSIDTVEISASYADADASEPRPAARHRRETSFKSPVRDKAQEKREQEEERRQTMQGLAELNAFLESHAPEEVEQWLIERSKQ